MSKRNGKLRRWQKEALDEAIRHYASGERQFLCVAAPGAGKTYFAAMCAKILIESGSVKVVVCIAPSTAVANGIKNTFSGVLNNPFNGKIGSLGLVLTYQSLQYCYDEIAQLLQNNKVLVISDEIHHCGFDAERESNRWGQYLSSIVSVGNPLVLTLSGTPWRSNKSKIALQQYSDEFDLTTNYIYGLGDAVRDGVCRSPKLALLDNSHITVSENDVSYTFGSIQEGVDAKKLNYRHLITDERPMVELLAKAVCELTNIKQTNQQAAGLVVASTISEAKRIQSILVTKFQQTALLVCNELSDSQEIISGFQSSNSSWLVSVGMVSEGTDIPRLQVCAYLSHVRTELYFRQVLGRILRINHSMDEPATMFSFADPELLGFAERISLDLPEEALEIIQRPSLQTPSEMNETENLSQHPKTQHDAEVFFSDSGSTRSSSHSLSDLTKAITSLCINSYRETILSL